MKPFFLFCVFCATLSCSKINIETDKQVVTNNCSYNTVAIVQKMNLNEDGTEYFYYLRLDKSPTGVQYVFPAQLDQSLKVVNKQLNISYNPTEQSHQFVLCPKGHIYDPFNPDYQYMPVVNLCSAKNKS